MIQQIRLDDLLAREIDVRWFEAVALIQAVCRQGLASNGSGAGFPSAADIVLDAGGRVSASAVGAGAGVAAAAAHMLAGMLKDDVPVRLRLIVTQTTGGIAYKSVEEFSEALGYFERPDSEQTLKSLFDRASQAPNRAVVPSREEVPAAPKQDTWTEPDQRRRRRHGSPLVVAAVATVLVCGSVLWLVGSDARTARLAASFGIVEDAPKSDTAAPAASEGRKHRQERNRNARSVSHTPDASTSKRSAATGSRPEHQHASVRPLLASNVSWIPNLLVSADSLAAQASHVPPGMVFYSSVEITASGDATRGDRPETEGAHVYTRSDTGVTPPRSVYPKLPDESDLGPRLATQTVLELLIDPRGLVEHVKLRTPPRNIHEFMIVSAAKAWQFEPARLDGQPVRFRQLIHLNMQ
jgi:hypothetical protein